MATIKVMDLYAQKIHYPMSFESLNLIIAIYLIVSRLNVQSKGLIPNLLYMEEFHYSIHKEKETY